MQICHIGVAVRNLDKALEFYRDVLGLPVVAVKTMEEHGVKVAFLDAGGARIELMEPLSERSPVAKRMQRQGPGVQHLAFRSPDVDGLGAELKAKGLWVMDQLPRQGCFGEKTLFLHPDSAHGVIVEFVEEPEAVAEE